MGGPPDGIETAGSGNPLQYLPVAFLACLPSRLALLQAISSLRPVRCGDGGS